MDLYNLALLLHPLLNAIDPTDNFASTVGTGGSTRSARAAHWPAAHKTATASSCTHHLLHHEVAEELCHHVLGGGVPVGTSTGCARVEEGGSGVGLGVLEEVQGGLGLLLLRK